MNFNSCQLQRTIPLYDCGELWLPSRITKRFRVVFCLGMDIFQAIIPKQPIVGSMAYNK